MSQKDQKNKVWVNLEDLTNDPAFVAVLGVVIGGLIVAMYLPIFQMGNVV